MYKVNLVKFPISMVLSQQVGERHGLDKRGKTKKRKKAQGNRKEKKTKKQQQKEQRPLSALQAFLRWRLFVFLLWSENGTLHLRHLREEHNVCAVTDVMQGGQGYESSHHIVTTIKVKKSKIHTHKTQARIY